MAASWPAAGAWATHVPDGFTLSFVIQQQGGSTWTGSQTTLEPDLSVATAGNETNVALGGEKTVLGGNASILSWDSTYDPDPFVTNNFVVVNNSGAVQTYTVTVGAPVSPGFGADQIIQSNIILTINDDDNANGATVSSVTGSPVYEAFVNGGSELTFLPDAFSNSCTSPFDCTFNGTSADAVASQAFGPAAVTSLGITIRFTLSAGDSATVQSRFEVVPEPATALLLALGLVGASVARRHGLG